MELFQSEESSFGTSLVVQWLRICIAIQEMWVQSLVRELKSHILRSNWARTTQLLSLHSTTRESMHPEAAKKIFFKEESSLVQKSPAHWKRPWRWEELRAEGEEGNRGWDDWMASLIQWTWTWANSRRWWGIGKPGVLQAIGSQRVGHDLVTEQQQLSQTWEWGMSEKVSFI